MLKKIAITLLSVSSISINHAQAETQVSKLESMNKTIFEMIYFGGPAAALSVFAEPFLSIKDTKTIKLGKNDAAFFAKHVVSSEAGEVNNLYKKMVIRIEENDQVTKIDMVTKNGMSSLEDVLVNTSGLNTLELADFEGLGLKINGRNVVSKKLLDAHAAAQRVLQNDQNYDGSKHAETMNAVILNSVVLNK